MTKIYRKLFSKTKEGTETQLFTLDNGRMAVDITDFGGTIVAIRIPDQNGDIVDVALGYETAEEYQTNGGYVGALIGRCANRLEDSNFTINGVKYQVAANDGKNHLHGGTVGFDQKIWNTEVSETANGESLVLTYLSVDGEENYPGNLTVTVEYRLTADNRLEIDYHAVSDQDTVVNLTNHAYFNLGGHASGAVLNHQIKLYADQYTDCNEQVLPNGLIKNVLGTPLDFTEFHAIGERIDADFPAIKDAGGYDHNWVLNASTDEVPLVGEVFEPSTGIKMNVFTNKPGMQFYTANFLDGTQKGKGEVFYQKRGGFCLETQYFPNAMKHTDFPSPVLRAGDTYHFITAYQFLNR